MTKLRHARFAIIATLQFFRWVAIEGVSLASLARQLEQNLALPFQLDNLLLIGVAPQLRWRLIIKGNSGLSDSLPYGAQDSLAEPEIG